MRVSMQNHPSQPCRLPRASRPPQGRFTLRRALPHLQASSILRLARHEYDLGNELRNAVPDDSLLVHARTVPSAFQAALAARIDGLGALAELEEIDDWRYRGRDLTWADPLRKIRWGAEEWALRALSIFSDDLKLAYKLGVTAGEMLDRVYKPDEGGLIDRFFRRGWLDMAGEGGRRDLLIKGLLWSADRMMAAKMPIHYFDGAAGLASYSFMMLERLNEKFMNLQRSQRQGDADVFIPQVRILLRDYLNKNVIKGDALIQSKSLDGVARFVRGDAFDMHSLIHLTWPGRNGQPEPYRPTLISQSGLWELRSNNIQVFMSMVGYFLALQPGGYLVTTTMPRNPNAERCSRVFLGDETPWAGKDVRCNMPLRRMHEVIGLLRAAGFDVLSEQTRETKRGIFGVLVARKPLEAWDKELQRQGQENA